MASICASTASQKALFGCVMVDGRTLPLLGDWALLFDYHKGILTRLLNSFCGRAFAPVRPVVETLVRACGVDAFRRLRQRSKF
jgi:hypothetical protein